MKNLLIALAISVISLNVSAKSFGDWYISKSNFKTTPSIEYPNQVFAIIAEPMGGGEQSVYFQAPSDSCYRYDSIDRPAEPSTINGTLVQMYKQCVGENIAVFYAKTPTGTAYIRNQFRNKTKVVLDDALTFSAVGFNTIYKYVIPIGI